jgi:hypothetical protein
MLRPGTVSANLIWREAHAVSIWILGSIRARRWRLTCLKIEERTKNIELVAVRQESETANIVATVFVPDAAAEHFLKKVEAYRAENTKPFACIVLG